MTCDIRRLDNKYIDAIVRVHMQAFPDFFLTFLGPRFLAEFYQSFTVDPQGIGFVALDSQTGKVQGAIVGPLVPDGYFKRLLRRRWYAFCLASVMAVLKRPSIAKRLFRAVAYRGEAPCGPKRSLLSSIAVSPEVQKAGVGRALVQAWVQDVKHRGSLGCFLTTDADGNEGVNRFYQKMGWTLECTYSTPEGRRMNRYILDFGAGEARVSQ